MEPRIFPQFASTALTFASLLGSAALSRAEVLVSEDFIYADGGLNGQTGGKGFSAAWASSTNVTGGVSTGSSASTRSLAIPFPSSGILWMSFDWGFAANPNPQAQFGGITFFKGGEERFLIGDVWDTKRIVDSTSQTVMTRRTLSGSQMGPYPEQRFRAQLKAGAV